MENDPRGGPLLVLQRVRVLWLDRSVSLDVTDGDGEGVLLGFIGATVSRRSVEDYSTNENRFIQFAATSDVR